MARKTSSKVVGTTMIATWPCILGVQEFTASGVATGSLAAGCQSCRSAMYGGYTAGVFSALQSAGATAAAPLVLPAVGGIASRAAALATRRLVRSNRQMNHNSR